MKSFCSPSSQRGNALFIILIAVVLFAALSYALSQGGNSTAGLEHEKTRLLASDVIDIGNNMAEATAKLRLRGVTDTNISFENSVVSGYANAACTSDACKVFAFDGGGKDWETPSTGVNGNVDMGFTGSLAVTNMGTSSADLVMIVPDISYGTCVKINSLLSIDNATHTPNVIASVAANKFTGSYSGSPVSITGTELDGQKSGCFKITTASGTAFGGALSGIYVFYQVLITR